MSGATPKVSIALPVYNGEKFVRKALDMLAKQTYTDYELVIIDNGSKDATSAICQEYAARDARIRYHRYETTIPVIDNFWRAFQLTRGKYFLWNAADDDRPPDAIARAVEVFERDARVVMVHGPVELFLPKDGSTVVIDNAMDLSDPLPAARVAAYVQGVTHNGMLYGVYRRDALSRVRFRQHPGQDYLVSLQMAMIGEIAHLPAPLVSYRHVWGAIREPMYVCTPVRWKDLLAYRGFKRWKCRITLWKGVKYLLLETGTPFRPRLAATRSFIKAFTTRYRRHLMTEALFALTAPVKWMATPFVSLALNAKHAKMNPRMPSA